MLRFHTHAKPHPARLWHGFVAHAYCGSRRHAATNNVSSVLIVIDDSELQLFTFLRFAPPARLAWEDSFPCVPCRGFEGF